MEVDYTHGYERVPDDIQGVVARRAAARVIATLQAKIRGVQSRAIGDRSESYGPYGMYGTLVQQWQQWEQPVLLRRRRNIAFA